MIILSRNYPTNSSPCCSINFTTSGGGGPSGGGGGLSVSPGSPTPRKNPSIPGGEKMKRTRVSTGAVRALTLGLELWNEVGAPYEAARARCGLAGALLALGDRAGSAD